MRRSSGTSCKARSSSGGSRVATNGRTATRANRPFGTTSPKSVAYVLTENDAVIACAAIILNGEPAYDAIDGEWLTDGRYATVHRVARTRDVKSRGVATTFLKLIEDLCIELGVPSIRLDTNFDNLAMLKILENLSYRYCGEIFYEGASRRAYEKILSQATDA